MNIEKKLFPAQEKDEKILLILRRHWFTYTIIWIVAFLLSAPTIVYLIFAINNPDSVTALVENIAILACSFNILLIFGLLINGFVDFYLDVYIVTDRRIVDIVQNGLFKREISELNLRMIQDVSAHVDGIFPTLLHYGDITIQTAGETSNFSFIKIPHPYEVSKKILDLHEAYAKPETSSTKGEDSIIREDFGSEQCYSNDTCNKVLLKNLDKAKEEQDQKVVKTETVAPVESTNIQKKSEEGDMEEGKEVDLK